MVRSSIKPIATVYPAELGLQASSETEMIDEEDGQPKRRKKKRKVDTEDKKRLTRILIAKFNVYIRYLILEVDQNSNNPHTVMRMANVIQMFRYAQERIYSVLDAKDDNDNDATKTVKQSCLLHTINFRITVPGPETRKRQNDTCFDMFNEDSCVQTAIHHTPCQRIRFTLLEPSKNTTARTVVLNPRERKSFLVNMAFYYNHIPDWFCSKGEDPWGDDEPMVKYRQKKNAIAHELLRNLKAELWAYLAWVESGMVGPLHSSDEKGQKPPQESQWVFAAHGVDNESAMQQEEPDWADDEDFEVEVDDDNDDDGDGYEGDEEEVDEDDEDEYHE